MQEVNKGLVRWLGGKVAAAKPDDLNLIPDSRGSSQLTPAIYL